jgi:alcohol dehydrogenase class IV
MSAKRPDWQLPVQVHLGSGLLAQYHPAAPVVVLADAHAVPADLVTVLRKRWGDKCLAWMWQTQGECETAALLDLAQPLWQVLAQDPRTRLLAVGGGTTLDMAKVLRWRPQHPVTQTDILQLWRGEGQTMSGDWLRHPLLCWPSTAGTGSEVSASATVWDRSGDRQQKLAWQPAHGHADEAWIDPVLCLTCPAQVTRDAALDALAHALESLWNVRANAMTRPLAERAVRLVMSHLPTALAQAHDLSARAALSEAALLAGMAMAQTQTALAHALSYDLTLHEGIAHGEAVAIWLPLVADRASRADAALRAQLQALMEAKNDPAEHLRQWLHGLGIATRGLEDLPGGQAGLLRALQSPRGQNQVGGRGHGL